MLHTDMLSLVNTSDPGILQSRAILPRLNFSRRLLDEILDGLAREGAVLSKHNGGGLDPEIDSELGLIERERLLVFAAAALSRIRGRLGSLSGVDLIPKVIPVLISVIRSVSSCVHGAYPEYGMRLCELSSILGGVLTDSASIAGARFDFKRSNLDSTILLDEAKLIADCKLSKLYPNLDY